MPHSIQPRSENQLLGAFIYELAFRDAARGWRTGAGLNIYSGLDTAAGDLTLTTDFVVLIEFKLDRKKAVNEWKKTVSDGMKGQKPGPKHQMLTLMKSEGLAGKSSALSRKGHFLAYGECDADVSGEGHAPYTLAFETYLDVVLNTAAGALSAFSRSSTTSRRFTIY